ncbi:MAG: YceI family protein [Phycisphaeraceae bacterium]|nr:YceI family protein [Phycisphaeraceae bacterium]
MNRVYSIGTVAVLVGLGTGLIAMSAEQDRSAGASGEGWNAPGAEGVAQLKASALASYTVDPVHSSVHFMIKHAGVSNFYGRFNTLQGTLVFDPENPESARMEFMVDTSSVDTGNAGRDDHLRSGDFFNARQFPQATFESTSFAVAEDMGENMYTVEGELTLHGETRPVTVYFEWLGTGEFRGNTVGAFQAQMEIQRRDFGMTTYSADDGSDTGPLGNTVQILLSAEAGRQ